MVTVDDYGSFDTAWCPGCGNHSILAAVKQALAGLGLAPHQILMVSGIGQAAKLPHYLRCNHLNGLHGRSLPAATGARLANRDIPIMVVGGDGDSYGEGGNHFLAALRRNPTLTQLVHDNQVYGLTKGQASPTAEEGRRTKAQPRGVASAPLNPVALAVAMRVNFVARGFSGEVEHLADLIVQAMRQPGYGLVDIYQPCVTYNKVNTFGWYRERCYKLGPEHDPADWQAAMARAAETGDRLPIGVLYRNDRATFESHFPTRGRLDGFRADKERLRDVMAGYF
jgi:2-oxoglutarate ferredoxin oxidoreductase subunit beta